jgi:GntR family transcriptional regulator
MPAGRKLTLVSSYAARQRAAKNLALPVDVRNRLLYHWINTVSTPMQIHISPTDGVPIYLQIVNQVKYLVSSGRLAEGEELPPIRVLAEKLLVNPNTVARAYRELEMAGIVLKRRTTGTYVSGSGTRLGRRDRLKIITRRIDALLAEARHMAIPLDELVELVCERDALMSLSTEK